VEAEDGLALALAEGVLELVAIAPLLKRRLDLLELEAVEPADPPQRLLHLGALLGQLARVLKPLPRRARAGLALVGTAVGDALGPGAEQLEGARLGEALLRFRDLDPNSVARQGAGDEDDQAIRPRQPPPAEGERVDLYLELLAPVTAGRRGLTGGALH
jgi:hypothetical protein